MTEQEFYKLLGERLKSLREKVGIKQKDAANKADMSAQFLSDIENRGKKISVYQLNRLIDALGFSIDDLFGKKKDFCMS